MLSDIKQEIQSRLQTVLVELFPGDDPLPDFELENPADPAHGDFATNFALRSARILRKPPLVIAEEVRRGLAGADLGGLVKTVEVKPPGFINFSLSDAALQRLVPEIFQGAERYGAGDIGRGESIQIEFVSANPTGPLSIAHARQAAVGDALGNILEFLGFEVTKEYYVNDGGNQIQKLGESIRCRALERFGGKAELPEGGYRGEYIREMAGEFCAARRLTDQPSVLAVPAGDWAKFGAEYLLNVIKEELHDFGVNFDVWTRESAVATEEEIASVLGELRDRKLVYEKDGALWFESTRFGDDKDRVVRKSDGTYTYLTPDIVYHKNKYDRGFSRVFNIWGPDHHGYIPRIKAAVQALGKDASAVEVLIVQLATIFRNGQAVSMSTRMGEFISLREILEEVGVDASRFFFMMRQIKSQLDFDLEIAKKETPENPVYYIQYAHARVFSINRKAREAGIVMEQNDFSALGGPDELALIKALAAFSESLVYCWQQRDPSPLVGYLMNLATVFHRFYDRCRVVDEDPGVSSQRLGLVNAARIVIANGLRLLGVSHPEHMEGRGGKDARV
jgi:arginyl-tRNA synthetase